MRQSFVVGACLLAVFATAPLARADIVSPAGACVATATWKANGVTKTSTALTADDVIEVPRADHVTWKGTVTGPVAGAAREVKGRVGIALPWPLGSVAVASWAGSDTDVESTGTYDYHLPSVVPAGVVLDLEATHDESGKRQCTANVGVIIPGGPFDSPLIWGALTGLLLFGGLVVLLGRGTPGAGRIMGAALLGLPFGLFLGLTTVLFGLFSLGGPMMAVLIVAGAIVAAAWVARHRFLPSRSA